MPVAVVSPIQDVGSGSAFRIAGPAADRDDTVDRLES
jgi:hypothetical protein